MKDEIKEILDKILLNCDTQKEKNKILDYITNLQTIEQQYSVILSENAELENKITNLQKEKDKYKNVIDKIKEIIKSSGSYKGICTQPQTDTFSYILELVEEVE